MVDVVASVVEKVLMNMGLQTYNQVNEILTDYDLTFTDCYEKPDVLNFALKQVFENSYLSVIEMIRNEFVGLADEHDELATFLQKLSEQ